MKYRKKPIVIEAVLWQPESPPSAYPDWLWNEIGSRPQLFNESTGVLTIRTLEGDMAANPGDWIIRGVKGEIYPCKPDIFAATYELAE
jgi:hypothetical protein